MFSFVYMSTLLQIQSSCVKQTNLQSISLSLFLSIFLSFSYMEAKLFLQQRGLSSIQIHQKLTKRPNSYPIVFAILTQPNHSITGVKLPERPAGTYNDNWFDKIAINHLSQSVQAITGMRNNKSGYDSLVEAAAMVSRYFNPSEQREIVIQALGKAFPRPILSLMRALLPQTKFTREYFAIFTTFFFAWLVGPCEVRESELEGKKEKNVVHIKKCRFLEESNCVGMCINLCKMPSQTFIKDSLGMPVNMVPNFDDMSCEMIFGQEPPEPANDPAFKKPCYKTLCNYFKKP